MRVSSTQTTNQISRNIDAEVGEKGTSGGPAARCGATCTPSLCVKPSSEAGAAPQTRRPREKTRRCPFPRAPVTEDILGTNGEGKARPPEGFRHARARGCILNTACHTFKAHEGGTRAAKAKGDAGERAFALSRLFFFPCIWPPQLTARSECAPCAPYRAACSCERVRMYPVSARGAKREARGVERERTAAATAG